eukprot:g32341.t1
MSSQIPSGLTRHLVLLASRFQDGALAASALAAAIRTAFACWVAGLYARKCPFHILEDYHLPWCSIQARPARGIHPEVWAPDSSSVVAKPDQLGLRA